MTTIFLIILCIALMYAVHVITKLQSQVQVLIKYNEDFAQQNFRLIQELESRDELPININIRNYEC